MLENVSKDFLNRFMLEIVKAESKQKKIIRPIRGFKPSLPTKKPIKSVAKAISAKAKETLSFDLGKINSFIQDKDVSMIECPGPNKKIKITKAGNIAEIELTLNDNEIKEILEKFSSQSKVLLNPVFNASISGLSISAIISEIIGSKFSINKA